MIDGVPYLDVGCSCKIPYEWAMEQGYERIVVIRTRDVSFRDRDRTRRDPPALMKRLAGKGLPMARRIYRTYPALTERLARREQSAMRRFYREYPALMAALEGSPTRYNEQCETLERLDREGRLLHLAPSKPVDVGTIEGDIGKLLALYTLGYNDCLDQLPHLIAYLKA